LLLGFEFFIGLAPVPGRRGILRPALLQLLFHLPARVGHEFLQALVFQSQAFDFVNHPVIVFVSLFHIVEQVGAGIVAAVENPMSFDHPPQVVEPVLQSEISFLV
jgi:hypothetical protein